MPANIPPGMDNTFAAALRMLLTVRHIPPSGPALAARLRRAGVSIHARTLTLLLRGERTPRPSTVERILQALDATDIERALVSQSLGSEAPNAVQTVSLVKAFVASGAVDRGRVREEVVWHYSIGSVDDEDRCTEMRRTHAGPEGLQVITFGPGQFGSAGFELLDLPKLGLHVRAARRTSADRPTDIATSLHVLELEPASNRYRVVVQFADRLIDEDVEWTVSYRWPGLWRSLRQHGLSVGRLRLESPPAITSTSVVLDAPAATFGDLTLLPVAPESGELHGQQQGDRLQVTWNVRLPPVELRFEVRSRQ